MIQTIKYDKKHHILQNSTFEWVSAGCGPLAHLTGFLWPVKIR
jgi:hypothetical protein